MSGSETASSGSATLWSLALYQLLASNRGGLFVVYMPLFLVEARGASDALALGIVSAGYVLASLTGPLAGRWSDRVGRRKPFLLVGEIGSFPLFLAIPFLPGVWASGGAFIAAQIVLSFAAPALNAFVADVSSQTSRGAGYGLLNATSSWGGIVGFVVAAVLVVPFGLNVVFYFVAAVMVGTVLVVSTWVPDLRLPPTTTRRPWREYRAVTVFATAVSIRSLGAGAVATFYGVNALALGANNLDVSIIAISGMAAAGCVSIPFGRFIDRRGEIRGIFYGTMIMLVGLLFFLFATNWVWFVPGQTLRWVGFALMGPGMLAFVSRLAPVGHRAEYLGVFSLVNSSMWSVGPLLGGVCLLLGGAPALYGFAFGSTLVSIAAIEGIYRLPARSASPPGEVGPA
ncbi:MAG TPA: MFS transporter [Thermoplasmata archaeon]|nr:MFS transporter [Thermoplasmata archaeon]